MACSTDTGPLVRIILEVPAEDAGGQLLADLDALRFLVSDGLEVRSSQQYQLRDGLPIELELANLPEGNDVSFHLSGTLRAAEVAYGRTCPLRIDDESAAFDARLYFSRSGRFRVIDAAPERGERVNGVAFADGDGRSVILGGSADPLLEFFDPRAARFEESSVTELPRIGGAIAVRPDRTAAIAGGRDPDGTLLTSIEEVRPRLSEPISIIGPADQPAATRALASMAALPTGDVALVGGRDAAGTISAQISILEEGDDQFRAVVDLETAREGATATVGPGGVVFIVSGRTPGPLPGDEELSGSVELFRPQDRSVRTVPVAALVQPRYLHTATAMPDGRILIVGGIRDIVTDAPAEAVEVFDPITDEIVVIGSIPGGIHGHTATLLPDGRVLIAGGRDDSGAPVSSAWLFDPGVDAVLATQRDMQVARAGHVATVVCDGTVVIVGGESEQAGPVPAERYNPAARGDI